MSGENNPQPDTPNSASESQVPPPIPPNNQSVLSEPEQQRRDNQVQIAVSLPEQGTRLVEWLQLSVNAALLIAGVWAIYIYGGQLKEMRGQYDAALRQIEITENEVGARLVFENFNLTTSADGVVIKFDLVNAGDSEATEIAEDGENSPAATSPWKDELLMEPGNPDPAGIVLEKGAKIPVEIDAPSREEVRARGLGWYVFRRYTYLDIFQRTKEVCQMAAWRKAKPYLAPCPPHERQQDQEANRN